MFRFLPKNNVNSSTILKIYLKACHQSCQECSGPDANSCQSCRDGWKMNEGSNVCEDINECLVRENACSGNQFCENNEGSYVCHDCDRSCSGCTGSGNQKCLECGPGNFRKIETNVRLSNINRKNTRL